jgi:CRISPR-associated protein Cas5d
MAYGVKLEVWGEYASFNRPEMKVERVSYEILTPSAARGILEAIYWKPQMRWIIDRIRVLAPIRFTHVRRNELDTTISAATVETAMRGRPTTLGISVEDHRQRRAAMILRDVRYGIEAHIEVIESAELDGKSLQHPEAKHLQTFKRRAATGQYFHHPYLGSREFPASFRLLADEELFPPCPAELQSERDLGFILWDIHFEADPNGAVVESHTGRRMRATPRFFHAHMRQGSVEVPPFAGTRG